MKAEPVPPRRPSWDEYFHAAAWLISSRSPCARLKVGCLLVKDNRIISSGYNGFITGVPHESVVVDGHEQMTVHAEVNAVADAAARGVAVQGCVAYITHYPCINCAKLLLSAGIRSIKYKDDYNNDALVARLLTCAGARIERSSGA